MILSASLASNSVKGLESKVKFSVICESGPPPTLWCCYRKCRVSLSWTFKCPRSSCRKHERGRRQRRGWRGCGELSIELLFLKDYGISLEQNLGPKVGAVAAFTKHLSNLREKKGDQDKEQVPPAPVGESSEV